MFRKPEQRDYDQVVAYMREHGFDLLEAPATANRIFLKKHNCSAAIEKDEHGGVRLFAKPGHLIAGEISRISRLIDRSSRAQTSSAWRWWANRIPSPRGRSSGRAVRPRQGLAYLLDHNPLGESVAVPKPFPFGTGDAFCALAQ